VRSDVKVIFLGDIVDRNPYDLQNLAFIVAFWILFPDNVFIVRGNHEDASVCSRYGFSEHLYQKAGSKDVFNPVWNLIIDFFSRLPLGFLFQSGSKRCVIFHGGFPFNEEHFKVWQLEEAEKYLNCFQKEHFDMDPLSQSILWADPDPTLSSGVAPTPQSGRPRFSEDAFLSFMNQNGINCMIRGHSKWDEGYKLFFDNRLISIFSTSTYDGQHIGDAKFLRLTPDITLPEIEDEESGKGKGILSINQSFLQAQLKKYYNVNCEM
jgi:diadenosine tetraphosphatase ApaH/serine/threonine PP2A family protein phosphatase